MLFFGNILNLDIFRVQVSEVARRFFNRCAKTILEQLFSDIITFTVRQSNLKDIKIWESEFYEEINARKGSLQKGLDKPQKKLNRMTTFVGLPFPRPQI